MNELPWIKYARTFIGVREYPGSKHNPTILDWLKKLGAWWSEDETPWCGTFVAEVLTTSKRKVVKEWYRALSWTAGGAVLSEPAYGCIVVFSRLGGGHVGFCVGKDVYGRIMVLGGNQGNTVSIRPFDRSRVKAYVWPADTSGFIRLPSPDKYSLPLLSSLGVPSSSNEA